MTIKPEVIIVDYGLGNILSVKRAVEECGGLPIISSDKNLIKSKNKIILPGVGAFKAGMSNLNRLGLSEVIIEISKKNKHLLGICLGMQLLFSESSEFGKTHGLNIIPGKVLPISSLSSESVKVKVPHIGWKSLIISQENLKLNFVLNNYKHDDYLYFLHSFMAVPNKNFYRIADFLYEKNRISAIVKKGNTIGFQFHPEKSGNVGIKLLSNWIKQ